MLKNINSVFLRSMLLSLIIFCVFSWFAFSSVQALTYGIDVGGNFTTFADEDVLNREIELTDEENLQLDMTSGGGFTLGGNIELEPGIFITARGGVIFASDSDRTIVEDSAETINAELMLASLHFKGQINLAEFSQMYELPDILLTGGPGYYLGSGEITSTADAFVDEDLEGGSFGLTLGTGLRHNLDNNLAVRANIGYRLLEIGFDQHTNLSGVKLSAGFIYNF